MARPKKQINPENYYTIYNWMLTDLGLEKGKLLAYAFIYAYSTNESGKGCYFGGYEAMSMAVGCTTKNLRNIVQELSEKGLVDIQQVTLENTLKRNYYRVNSEPLVELVEKYGYESISRGLEVLKKFDADWVNLYRLSKAVKKIKKFNEPRVF